MKLSTEVGELADLRISRGGLLWSGACRHSVHGGRSPNLDRLAGWLCLLASCLLRGERLEEAVTRGLEIECVRVHPGVSADLLDCGPLFSVVAEEAEDQVLEVVAEVGSIHLLEVGVNLAVEKEFVEVFFFASLFKGEDALDNDEEDDSDGEHVDFGALVLLALLDLGSHVGHGAAVRLESIDVLVTGEAEVGNF